MHRISQLSRWTWTNDLPYYRMSALKAITIFILLMQMPNLRWAINHGNDDDFPVFFSLIMLIGGLIFGSSCMFLSFEKNNDRFRELHMLPCSNMEKYLVRYLTGFLINFVIILTSIIIGDLLQYVVGLIVQREPLSLVMVRLYEHFSQPSDNDSIGGSFLLMLGLYTHTVYLLGANLFRNVKYSWVFTSILFTILWIVCIYIFSLMLRPSVEAGPISQQLHDLLSNHLLTINLMLLALSAFNVWLSYKLFCSRQLIGRWINWI